MTHPQQGGGYGSPQHGGYGPLPGHPQPGGYGPYPPKKPNTGLVVGLVVTVVVAALGLVLVLTLTGEDDDKPPGTAGGAPGGEVPELTYTADDEPGGSEPAGSDSSGGAGSAGELALTVARIIEEYDAGAVEEYACDAGEAHFLQEDLEQLEGFEVTARPGPVEQTSETTAEVTIAVTVQGETMDYPLRMQRRDDSWCAVRVR